MTKLMDAIKKTRERRDAAIKRAQKQLAVTQSAKPSLRWLKRIRGC